VLRDLLRTIDLTRQTKDNSTYFSFSSCHNFAKEENNTVIVFEKSIWQETNDDKKKKLKKNKIQTVTISNDVLDLTSLSMAENTRSKRKKTNDNVEALTAIQSSFQGDSTVRKDTGENSKEQHVMGIEEIDKSEKNLELRNKYDSIESSSEAMILENCKLIQLLYFFIAFVSVTITNNLIHF
jgi:hypothetical protein